MKARGLVGLVIVLGCALEWAGGRGGAADEKGGLPDDLARVPAGALGFFSGRPADLWDSPVGKAVRAKMGKDADEIPARVQKALGLSVADLERVTVVMESSPNEVPLFLLLTRKPYDREKIKEGVRGGEEEKVPGGVLVKQGREAVGFAGERLVMLGQPDAVRAALAGKSAEGPLTPALKLAAGEHLAVQAASPAAILRALPGELPAEMEAFRPLLVAKLLVVTAGLGENATLDARMVFADGKQAKAAERPVIALLALATGGVEAGIRTLAKEKDTKEIVALMKVVQNELKEATPKVAGTELKLRLQMKADSASLAAQAVLAVRKLREAAARAQSANNLKQLGLALHNYHDANNQFPPAAVTGKDGKPLLSWRVLILPYIEQDALYKEFRLNEPWDSEHNKKLLARMPQTYAHPSSDAIGRFATHYQAFTGKGTVFEGKRGIRLTDITDGTSNTLGIVEAATAVPWTKPDDVVYAEGKPLPKLGGLFQNGFNALFCDGSVRFLSASIKPDTLRALITRNGGEVIANDE